MSDHSSSQANATIDVRQHVKIYVSIFVGLIVLTLVTVGVSQLPMPVTARITIALMFALTQGFLSVAYLMHLSAERKFIYGVLLLTVIFFGVLIFLPLLTQADSTTTLKSHSNSSPKPAHAHVH